MKPSLPRQPEPEGKAESLKHTEFTPSRRAPELDYTAMRELANDTARTAIESSHRSKRRRGTLLYLAMTVFFVLGALASLGAAVMLQSYVLCGSSIFFMIGACIGYSLMPKGRDAYPRSASEKKDAEQADEAKGENSMPGEPADDAAKAAGANPPGPAQVLENVEPVSDAPTQAEEFEPRLLDD